MPEGETTVGVQDFQENLTTYLRQVREGASLVVVSDGEPLARVTPPPGRPAAQGPRVLGALEGRFELPDEFPETPDWLIDIMENGQIEPPPPR